MRRFGNFFIGAVVFALFVAALTGALETAFYTYVTPDYIEDNVLSGERVALADPVLRRLAIAALIEQLWRQLLVAVLAGSGLTALWLVIGSFVPIAFPSTVSRWMLLWLLLLLCGAIFVPLWNFYEIWDAQFRENFLERLHIPLAAVTLAFFVLFFWPLGTLLFSPRALRPAVPAGHHLSFMYHLRFL